ncbi:unnamed protein product, partial [Oppiella nova]
RLYTYDNNWRAFKALIASQYSGVAVDVVKDFQLGETNTRPDFLKKFPFGKVPALETKDGHSLIESNAIAFYVSNDQLKGKTPLDQALVIQWLSFADNEINPSAYTWVLPALGAIAANKQAVDRSKTDITKILNYLNDFLLTKRADTSTKKDKKEKTPKQEKPKEKKEEAADLGDDDEDMPLEPKAKDPFEAFPKGTWVMDDFKRFYSNNPEEKSIPYFWEKFDKNNYSIWFCNYKYADELTLVFMSCNLIAGMYQRLDKMRKNAFGSMILFGEDHNSSISGIWVWKGHELAFPLSTDWQVDYESYDWKKLDPNDPKTHTMVKEYFSWEGNFDGKKFNQGKIFK